MEAVKMIDWNVSFWPDVPFNELPVVLQVMYFLLVPWMVGTAFSVMKQSRKTIRSLLVDRAFISCTLMGIGTVLLVWIRGNEVAEITLFLFWWTMISVVIATEISYWRGDNGKEVSGRDRESKSKK